MALHVPITHRPTFLTIGILKMKSISGDEKSMA